MKLREIGTIFATAMLLTGATPLSAQVEQGVGDDAQLGEAYRVGERRPLEFTLTSAREALGWTRHERYGTPTGDEKMLILEFRVENVGDRSVDFSYNSLEISAVDDQSFRHERDNPIGIYREGTEQELDGDLPASSAVDAYTAIIVPADRSITELFVSAREGGTPVLRYDLQGVLEPLPAVLRADGAQAVRRPLQGQLGFFYPTGAFDVRVSGVETRDTPELAGRNLGDGMQWVLVTLDVRSRFDRTVPVDYSEFRASFLIDDSGSDHENIRSLHPLRDEWYDGEVDPGEIETIRLLYRISEDAEPEALALQARTPSSDAGLTTRVEFDGSGAAGPDDAASAQQLGDGRASTFAAGIYDPLNRTFAVAQAEIPGAMLPPGEALIPDPPVEDSTPEGDTAEDPPGDTGDDMSQYIRDGDFRITAMRAVNQQEDSGDEPYYLLTKFRGVLGQPETEEVFALVDDRPFSYRGANWLTESNAYTSFGNDHVFDFSDLRPYEIYGVLLIIMDDDNSGADEVKEMATAFAREARRRWLATLDVPLDLDLESADESVQRAYVRAARRVEDRFFGGTGSSYRLLAGEARTFADDILGGLDDDDDYLGFIGAAWINVPTLGREEVFAGLGTSQDAGTEFYSPGEHTVRRQYLTVMMKFEFRYDFRLENRLSR